MVLVEAILVEATGGESATAVVKSDFLYILVGHLEVEPRAKDPTVVPIVVDLTEAIGEMSFLASTMLECETRHMQMIPVNIPYQMKN